MENATDDVTAPRHAQLTQDGQFSLAIKWDQPDCGSVGEYQVGIYSHLLNTFLICRWN